MISDNILSYFKIKLMSDEKEFEMFMDEFLNEFNNNVLETIKCDYIRDRVLDVHEIMKICVIKYKNDETIYKITQIIINNLLKIRSRIDDVRKEGFDKQFNIMISLINIFYKHMVKTVNNYFQLTYINT